LDFVNIERHYNLTLNSYNLSFRWEVQIFLPGKTENLLQREEESKANMRE
jgi:hypothetical protein